MIIIAGSITVRADRRDEALDLGREHSARSRTEPGCIVHGCHVDADNPLRLHFFEKWEDETAVKAHFALPQSRQFMERMGACASAAPELEIYRAERVDAQAL